MARFDKTAIAYIILVVVAALAISVQTYVLVHQQRRLDRQQDQTVALIHQNRMLAKQGAQARDAFCALRIERIQQIQQTKDYIADLEAGRRQPIPGITIADLKRSLLTPEGTLRATSDLGCAR